MIFGFNTDIRHEDTVYHVQSEAREGEQLLQTQVFVRGRCIGKRAISFASMAVSGRENSAHSPDPSATNQNDAQNDDQKKEKRLRDLHREVLDAIRDGRLDSVLDKRDTPETLAAVKELDLEWTNAESVHAGGTLMMHLTVAEGGAPVPGARLTFRFTRPDASPYYAQILTDSAGKAEMTVQVDEKSLPDASVLVQASVGGRTVTRKFQLRQTT